MKVTKEQLIKEKTELEMKVVHLTDADLSRRTTLSGLLNSYETEVDSWSNKRTQKIFVRDWLGIAFLIGELKSDADFSCMLEGKEIFRRENEELKQQIYKLTHPEEFNK